MSTWNRKLNWVFKKNAQLRKDYLRVKPIWRSGDGNRENQNSPFTRLIENSHLKDWNYSRRVNELIRLTDSKKIIHVENWN